MGKKLFMIIACGLMCCSQIICRAERKDFEQRTVLHKGEHVANFGITYMNVGTNNSDLFLTITNLDAKGSLLRFTPSYSYAYKDNQSIGLRLGYTQINGGADNLSLQLLDLLEVKDVAFKVNSRNAGATLYHRNFFGLDKKGNCGLYLEVGLGYKYGYSQLGNNPDEGYTNSQQLRLSFAPGFMLYVLPFCSLNLQIGLADVSYNTSVLYKNGQKDGSLSRLKGGVGLNLMDFIFGINFHF